MSTASDNRLTGTPAPETLAQELPQREIGKGSMGIVYEARVRASGERIALKVLPPSLSLTERALARFHREGRIMARIVHQDIVRVLDQATKGRLHWFAMEFVSGVTLQERRQVGPLPVRQACLIGVQVARAAVIASVTPSTSIRRPRSLSCGRFSHPTRLPDTPIRDYQNLLNLHRR